MNSTGPQRIVCLTEETTEWLYLLGEQARILGISGYTVRPPQARQEKPRVSAFLSGKIDKIVALRPDLVIGFSDMQAHLADQLIRAGLNVLVTNQRSVAQIFDTLRLVAGLVQASDAAERWIGEGLRYADSISTVSDPLLFDWRDALQRLRDAKPHRVLASYVSSLRPGQTLLLVNPIIRTASWGAPWTALVRKRSAQWQRQADRNPRLVRIGVQPRFGHGVLPRGVRVTLYRKTAATRDVAAERHALEALQGAP